MMLVDMPEMTPSSCISRGASDLRAGFCQNAKLSPPHLLPQEWDALLVDGRGGGHYPVQCLEDNAPRILRVHLRLLRAVPDEVGFDVDGNVPELPGPVRWSA